jgi:hypothetical protein
MDGFGQQELDRVATPLHPGRTDSTRISYKTRAPIIGDTRFDYIECGGQYVDGQWVRNPRDRSDILLEGYAAHAYRGGTFTRNWDELTLAERNGRKHYITRSRHRYNNR